MFTRSSARIVARMSRRFESHAAQAEPKAATFDNKYNFNIAPPPVHAYWNARNFSVLVVLTPIILGVGYLGKFTGQNIEGYEGLLTFADSKNSPLNEIKFGEPQAKKTNAS